MGERKVLNKYYPPDFDPAKIPRRKNDKNKQIKVRMMLPMSIRCSTCGTYIYKGTKFNSRKEDVVGETYLGIQIFRFYFKCTKCSAEITMKTDPQNSDYVVESGAARNFEPWRAEDEVADSERKQRDAEEMGDAMKTLENKAMDSKQDMDILAALEEMKSMKTRHETVSPEVLLEILTLARNEKEKQVEEVEKADEEIIKSIVFHNSKDFVRRIQDDDDDDEDIEDGQASSNLDEKEDHNFKRKRTLGNPTDSLTPISIFNNSKTGDTGAVAPKPKFVLKPRIATNGAKRPCVRPSESDKPKVEANTKGSGTNVLQSICANYDSDDSTLECWNFALEWVVPLLTHKG